MENKADKNKEQDKLSENNYDTNPPTEIIQNKNRKSETPSTDETNKHADLEKFKRGELGAEHFRYNDDGPRGGK